MDILISTLTLKTVLNVIDERMEYFNKIKESAASGETPLADANVFLPIYESFYEQFTDLLEQAHEKGVAVSHVIVTVKGQ